MSDNILQDDDEVRLLTKSVSKSDQKLVFEFYVTNLAS